MALRYGAKLCCRVAYTTKNLAEFWHRSVVADDVLPEILLPTHSLKMAAFIAQKRMSNHIAGAQHPSREPVLHKNASEIARNLGPLSKRHSGQSSLFALHLPCGGQEVGDVAPTAHSKPGRAGFSEGVKEIEAV